MELVNRSSLLVIRDEWDRIRFWSKQNGTDPRHLKRQEKQALIQHSSGPTLQQACESYLASATSKAAQKEYPNLICNQVLPHFGGETALEHLCWDGKGPSLKKGCEFVVDYFRLVEARAPVQAKKSLMVLRMVFDHAIDQGWMELDKNPALGSGGAKGKHKPTPHPTLLWEQLPQFFE